MSPGVSRSSTSRGTTRRSARGRRTRTEPNSSRSVTRMMPSGPPANPPLRLRSTSDRLPAGGASGSRLVGLARMSASARSSASRADWSDASTTRAPSLRHRATVVAMDPMGTGGSDGSCQPNGLPPGGASAASLSQVSWSVRAVDRRSLPGSRFRDRHPASPPGSSPAVSRSARRSSACAHRKVAAASMSPGSSTTRMRVLQMVERRGRREQAAPGLRRVPQRAALQRREVRGEAIRQPVRACRPSRCRSSAPLAAGEQELARGQEPGHAAPVRHPAGRPDRTRASTRSRRRTTRRAPAVAARPGRRRRGRRDGSSRPGRRPRAPSRSPGPRARAAPGPATAADPVAAPARRGAIWSGASVRWNSAWTEATRTRAGAVGGGPGGEGRDPRGALVADQLRALPGKRGPWLEGDDRRRIAEPRGELLGRAVGDLGVTGDPEQTLAGRLGERRGEIGLGAVGDAGIGDVAERGPTVPRWSAATARSWSCPGGREDTREAGEVRDPVTGALAGQPQTMPPGRAVAASTWASIRRSRPRRPRIDVRGSVIGACRCPFAAADASPVRVRRMPSASGWSSPRNPEPGLRRRGLRRPLRLRRRPWRIRRAARAAARRSSDSRPAHRRRAPTTRPRLRPHPGRRSRSACSSAANADSTWSMAEPPWPPMPTRSRGNFWVPISATIERRPLWVPALPSSRSRSRPSGRSKSSTTTSMSSSGTWSRASTLRTATPDRFMNVVGLTSARSMSWYRPRTVTEASRDFWRPDKPARSASRSSTIQPML